MSTSWLLALLVWVHVAYYWFPNQHASFTSFLGGLTAILLWRMRGRRWGARWWVVMFGVEEGAQVFVCQLAYNWFPVSDDVPAGMCVTYSGLPLHWWGLCGLAAIALFIAQELNKHG